MFKSSLTILALGLGVSLSVFAQTSDIEGTWRSIDDRTGFSKGLVEIKQEADGTYSGTIVKVIPRPGYTPKEFCQHCPAPYTDKPMIGLKVLNGLKASNQTGQYINGRLMDPLTGKIYQSKAKLSTDGRRLTMRGYVGVSLLGRSQTWMREQ